MALFGGQNGLMRPGIAAAEPQNELAPRPTAADAYTAATGSTQNPASAAWTWLTTPIDPWLEKQRAISADRGLWQGGSVLEGGGPTGAGWVDAAGQYTNALMMGTTAPGRPGFTAYHGSPHDFPPTARNPHGEFDPAKIGTGEGAQAYGVGAAYLAEAEQLAQFYRKKLSGPRADYTGEISPAFKTALEAEDYLGFDNAGQAVSALRQHPDWRSRWDVANPDALAKELAAHDAAKYGGQGKMYEVQVNADPEHFLHWDKPISEQSPQIQGLAKRVGLDPRDFDIVKGAALYRKAGDVFGPQGGGSNFDAAASAGLRDAGIPGIRYLDAGSRDAGAGSHNYVVFDAATLDILRKYGLAGLMLGGGAAAGAQGSGE